jgi:antitoxin ParD1/3/4
MFVMAIVRKSITFTEQLNQWVQGIVSSGDYANESEYIRDLIRHDRERRENGKSLRQELEYGLQSGVSDRSVADIWKEAEAKYGKKDER